MIDVSSPLFANLLYLALVAGFWLVSLALISPGTGAYEIFALMMLTGAGFGLFYVPFNGWAFIPLAIAVILFILSIFLRKWDEVWLGGSAIMLILGSVFLFRSPNGGPAVHPILASAVSLLTLWFYWFAIRKSIMAHRMRSSLDPWAVMDQVGEVRSSIDPYGTVYVGGELWSAYSDHPIQPGEKVRIQSRQGLVLQVESIHRPTNTSKDEGEQ